MRGVGPEVRNRDRSRHPPVTGLAGNLGFLRWFTRWLPERMTRIRAIQDAWPRR